MSFECRMQPPRSGAYFRGRVCLLVRPDTRARIPAARLV